MYSVLIAEDEILIRDGIAAFINSLEGLFVCGCAGDGEEAMRMIREYSPNILITDILMPRMDGLELVEQSAEVNPEMKTIIISGHNEFKYAQQAIHLGVSQYLLKPVLPEEIQKALNQTVDEIITRRNFLTNLTELTQSLEETRPVLQEHFLMQLVTGHIHGEDALKQASFLSVNLNGNFFGVAILKANQNIPADQGFHSDDLTKVLILNVAQTIFKDVARVHPFWMNNQNITLVLCAKAPLEGEAFTLINRAVQKMVSSFERHFQMPLSAGIGRLYKDIDKLSSSYNEALEALEYTFSSCQASIINYEDICIPSENTLSRPTEMIRELLISVKFDEFSKPASYVKRIFEYYARQSTNPFRAGLIKAEILEIALTLLRSEDEVATEDGSGLQRSRMQFYESVEKARDMAELEEVMLLFLKASWERRQTKRLGRAEVTVRKMQDYVKKYYSSEDFNLDFIASNLFMSVNYMRQIFKHHVGESFVEYLTRIRLEHAAVLLHEDKLLVQDIAKAVGYENQRYFAICFKKQYKMTPTEYREINK